MLRTPLLQHIRCAHSTVSSSARPYWKKNPQLDSIIRVDHAGELGADRIYAGQMAVLGRTAEGPLIQHMWDQEKKHRAKFEELINEYRVRPTALMPIWNVAGFVLGAGTALLGKEAAMACTVAVETVIVDHYNDQLRVLMEDPNIDKEILETITNFRNEEQEHHDTGITHGAEQAPFYKAMTEVIKAGCTALLGKEAAMACTVAVETVIVDHYNDQLRVLMEDPNIDKEILETITNFRNEEQEHHDTGITHGAEQAPFYKAMTEVIKAGCKAAIAISKQV